MVHDGRLVAGPGKFKFKCNLFKAVIHEALQNGLTGFCGSGGQLLGCRSESVGNVPEPTGQAASCRKPQDLDNTPRGRSISTKEVNRKLGIAPIAMELGQRRLGWATKIPARFTLCTARARPDGERERSGRQGRWYVRRWAKSPMPSESASLFSQ